MGRVTHNNRRQRIAGIVGIAMLTLTGLAPLASRAFAGRSAYSDYDTPMVWAKHERGSYPIGTVALEWAAIVVVYGAAIIVMDDQRSDRRYRLQRIVIASGAGVFALTCLFPHAGYMEWIPATPHAAVSHRDDECPCRSLGGWTWGHEHIFLYSAHTGIRWDLLSREWATIATVTVALAYLARLSTTGRREPSPPNDPSAMLRSPLGI